MTEYVVLVDKQDQPIWTMEKLEAHKNWGHLHRAFSVLVFNSKWELLLQQRALTKYHCPWLWANTTCSHPRKWESYLDWATRRLQEEMGFECDLQEKFHFIYKAHFDNGLTEYEFDRVFFGNYDWKINPNPEEVVGFRWVSLEDLKKEMAEKPEDFAEWFRILMTKIS